MQTEVTSQKKGVQATLLPSPRAFFEVKLRLYDFVIHANRGDESEERRPSHPTPKSTCLFFADHIYMSRSSISSILKSPMSKSPMSGISNAGSSGSSSSSGGS